MINGVLAQDHLTVGSSESLNPFCAYFLGSGVLTWRRDTQQLAESHCGPLTCEVRAIMVGKTKSSHGDILPRDIKNQ